MSATLDTLTDALYGVAGWTVVLAVSFAVVVLLGAAARALAPWIVGVLVRLGVID